MALKSLPEPESYHGIPVLDLKVGDPIPSPRAPMRYAVRVFPDLARYLLTFNHPNNRVPRQRKWEMYAGDMTAGRWRFTPESLVFSSAGVLHNGVHRLQAVTHFGGSVWMMMDFGWPDGIISALDRGATRTNQDTVRMGQQENSATVASIISLVSRYDRTISTTRSWVGIPTPSSVEVADLIASDPKPWQMAARAGLRVYRALDHGATGTVWGAAFHIIGRLHPDRIDAFFDEIVEGTGAKGAPTRVLADWFRRRPSSMTKTGDAREPLELIVRGFNAWLTSKPLAFVKFRGFPLSRVRPADE